LPGTGRAVGNSVVVGAVEGGELVEAVSLRVVADVARGEADGRLSAVEAVVREVVAVAGRCVVGATGRPGVTTSVVPVAAVSVVVVVVVVVPSSGSMRSRT
jgi:hypothetical protein